MGKRINLNDYELEAEQGIHSNRCLSYRSRSESDKVKVLVAEASGLVICHCDGTAKAIADCLANLKLIRHTPEGGISMAENMYACAIRGQYAIENAIKPR